MVGEVRDAETARIAVEAALTGHMLLTTLHTNDAPGAITRLNEMGIESFLTSSAVDCVVAQRLARVLCPHCKRRTVVPQAALTEAGFRVGADLEAYEPVGCARCHRIGYRGRIGIYSVMVMTERIKEMVVELRLRGGDRQGRDRGGNADPARGRPGQGARRRHQHRGGGPGRVLGGSLRPKLGLKPEAPTDDLSQSRHGSEHRNFDFAEVLTRMADGAGLRRPPEPGLPARDPRARPDRAAGRVREALAAADARHRLQHAQRRPAQAVRVEQAARPRLRRPRRRPLPRQLLLPARLDQRRLPPDPPRDPRARGARPAAGAARSSPGSRAASSSSPARPARASRPRWRRWSTSSTASARSTSSRSRTRSSSCTRHKSCIVNQREIGADADDFSLALKSALREDPDVILVGEMRDLETMSTALTAAETGHLVFATLHTQSTAQTVDRIIDVFPAEQQRQVRMQLSIALQGIVTQQLLPTADGTGRVVACEVLVPTPAVRNLIREGKTHQIYSALQTSGSQGMQTMDAHLAQLVRMGRITQEAGRAARLRAGGAKRLPSRARRRRPSTTDGTAQARRGRLRSRIDEHLRLPRSRRRRGPLARRGRGRDQVAGHRAAPPARPDRPRRLREGGGVQVREPHRPLPRDQHARARGLLAPVRDPGRLGDADAALALHARGPDRGRAARGGDHGVRQDVEAGSSLADAMERRPNVFDTLFRAMVRSGEGSGRLEEALERVAFHLEKMDALRRQIRSAMMYPSFVLVLALVIMHVAVVAFIVPIFAGIFEEIASEQPGERAELPAADQDHDGHLQRDHGLLVHLGPGDSLGADLRLHPVEEDRARPAPVGPDQAPRSRSTSATSSRRSRSRAGRGPSRAPSPPASRSCSRSRSPARPPATR